MTKKITKATPEQWAEIEKIKQHVIDSQTDQYPDHEIEDAVKAMWDAIGHPADRVIIADSPEACIRAYLDMDPTHTRKDALEAMYISCWWAAWQGWYAGARVLGVQFDQEKYDLFEQWCKYCPFVLAFEVPFVSRKPVKIHWQDGELHNESGMSVEFVDGTGVYSITGVAVDEQIVMRPETQTVEQINNEENEEVKRIRIERYGWQNYLTAMNARVVDQNFSEVEQTKEVLFACDDMKVLLCGCPSTARMYSMEVPSEINTCNEAQEWIRNKPIHRCIGAS